ncbi:MAG: hypothetical protein V2J89_14760 [Halieaceae bacterium]|jgi:hypothetical protein|nr:hypothetical protein [Halieaceae bacterium]
MTEPSTDNSANAQHAREDRRTLKNLGVFLLGFAVFALVMALGVTWFGPAL